jgi:hypothetical protein
LGDANIFLRPLLVEASEGDIGVQARSEVQRLLQRERMHFREGGRDENQ